MRILITGVSTRAIAQSATAAGWDFVSLDYFGDYDQKTWCENYSLKRDLGLPYGPGRLYQASRRLAYDALVYTASLENHPGIVAQLAAGRHEGGPGVLGNGPEVLRRVRHWPAFFGFLAEQGFPAPRTLPAGQAAPPDAPGPWLRKPVSSGGGHGVERWPAGRLPGRGFMLQEYLPGRPCSAAFVANGREAVVLGLTEQLIGQPEFGAARFLYCGNVFPLAWAEDAAGPDVLAQVRELIGALTRAFRLVGLNGLDFVLYDGLVYPLEVNPRYSAAMELIELAAGLSMFTCHVAAALRGELPALPEALRAAPEAGRAPGRGSYGKAILYAEQACRAPDTRRWIERGLRDVPFPGEEILPGSPVCTVLASGPDAEACYARLVDQAEELKGELYA